MKTAITAALLVYVALASTSINATTLKSLSAPATLTASALVCSYPWELHKEEQQILKHTTMLAPLGYWPMHLVDGCHISRRPRKVTVVLQNSDWPQYEEVEIAKGQKWRDQHNVPDGLLGMEMWVNQGAVKMHPRSRTIP